MSEYSDVGEDYKGAIPGLGYVGVPFPQKGLYYFFKRIFDLTAIIVTLPLWLPLLAVLAAVVRLEGHDVFFVQKRVGLHGREFKLWKFRTMVPDAERKLLEYIAQNPEARKEWDEAQKLTNDPRITPIGQILRRTSADELPQLWNVLRGEMSLVGPRPMLPSQRALYPGNAYYEMRPGLTGSWQVSDRNKCSFAGRALYDASYFSEMSFWVDVKILFKTIFVVFNATGV